MHYLSPEEILAIHAEIIDRYGGLHGLRDLGLLDSAAARPRAGFGDFEAYPSLFEKAAVLLYSLIRNHAFLDGNKRTGVVCTVIFLERNGYHLKITTNTLVQLALDIANDKINEKEITEKLKTGSTKS